MAVCHGIRDVGTMTAIKAGHDRPATRRGKRWGAGLCRRDLPSATCPRSWLLCGLLVLTVSGCGFLEDSEGPAKKSAPRKTAQPAPKASDVAPPPPPLAPTRFIELNVGGRTLKISSCYLKLVRSTSRTPAVLMVTSYASQEAESYPSFFMRVVLPGDELAALLGQSLSARIWYAAQPNDIVYYTPEGEPANVTIRNTDDSGRVQGTIINAKLMDTANDESKPISGQFDGVLEESGLE